LSLLSQAVVANKNTLDSNVGPLAATKSLLHKCLSQLTRQQQIHAQQAAWYIRGHSDAVMSHAVVPMMSGALLATVKKMYPLHIGNDSANIENEDEDFEEDDDCEPTLKIPAAEYPVRVIVTPLGEVVHSSQIADYLYCDPALSKVSFYEFIHRFSIERCTKTSRIGAFKRFELQPPHCKAGKYQIAERINYETGPAHKLHIPQVIGASIPWKTSLP
jgi:hypothetical protein